MKNIFDTLINSYIENNVGITEDFLDTSLAASLKENLLKLFDENKLVTAGTGNSESVDYNKLFRSDKIFWLDKKNNNEYENRFFDLMDSFISHLNENCYTGITGYEFHYTMYEKGSFYKKHRDQFKNNDSRKYSMIMYLNDNWNEADGGELCIHHDNKLENISPTNGKSVFFKSDELEHEVLVTNKARMSITGWLKINS